jgi:sigma-E factor negative regulatory protein RseA
MSEELHQKISQFLDNELAAEEALHLLHTMQHKEDLHHKMQRYQAISHALKHQVFLPVKTDFSTRIARVIHEHEPLHGIACPIERVINPFKPSWLVTLVIVIAIASAVTIKLINQPPKLSPPPLAKQQQNNTLQYNNQYALNRQINQYLLLHHNDVNKADKTDVKTVGYQHK